MKKSIIALFAGVALFAGLSTAADAKVNVRVFLGQPYYDYQVGPDYRYYDGRGWYQYQPDYQYQPRFRGRISCNEARRLVRQRGFHNVRARECEGRTYTFIAVRNDRRVVIYVNARTGAVWRG